MCSNLVNPLEQLCKECKKIGSVSAILASREIEDWGVLVSKEEKKNENTCNKKDTEHRNKSGKISKYLDRNQDTLDALDYDDLKK